MDQQPQDRLTDARPSSLADLTDLDIPLTKLDSTLFPGLSSSIKVHSGFAAEHAKYTNLVRAQSF